MYICVRFKVQGLKALWIWKLNRTEALSKLFTVSTSVVPAGGQPVVVLYVSRSRYLLSPIS